MRERALDWQTKAFGTSPPAGAPVAASIRSACLRRVEVFKGADGWDVTKEGAGKGAKQVRPSEINHGNIAPTVQPLGITCDHAEHTAVLSFAGLRRLALRRWRTGRGGTRAARRPRPRRADRAGCARLCAALACDLVCEAARRWNWCMRTARSSKIEVDREAAQALYAAALEAARNRIPLARRACTAHAAGQARRDRPPQPELALEGEGGEAEESDEPRPRNRASARRRLRRPKPGEYRAGLAAAAGPGVLRARRRMGRPGRTARRAQALEWLESKTRPKSPPATARREPPQPCSCRRTIRRRACRRPYGPAAPPPAAAAALSGIPADEPTVRLVWLKTEADGGTFAALTRSRPTPLCRPFRQPDPLPLLDRRCARTTTPPRRQFIAVGSPNWSASIAPTAAKPRRNQYEQRPSPKPLSPPAASLPIAGSCSSMSWASPNGVTCRTFAPRRSSPRRCGTPSWPAITDRAGRTRPRQVSGHSADGAPLAAPHLAIAPLAFARLAVR